MAAATSNDPLINQIQSLVLNDVIQAAGSSAKVEELTAAQFQQTKQVVGQVFDLSLKIIQGLIDENVKGQFSEAKKVTEVYINTQLEGCSEEFDADLAKHGIDAAKLKEESKLSQSFDPIDEFLRWLAESSQISEAKTAPIDQITDSLLKDLWRNFLDDHKTAYTFHVITWQEKTEEVILTQPHVAIMLGDIALLSSMLAKNLSCHTACNQNYQLAHFAAMFRRYHMLSMLHSMGAKFEEKCASGASVYDLLRAQGYGIQPKIHIAAFEHESVDVDAFSRYFKRTFLPTSVHSSAALFQLWLLKIKPTDPSVISSTSAHIFRKYLSKANSPPPVYAQKMLEKHLSNQWKLCVRGRVKAGDFLLTQTGYIYSKFHKPLGRDHIPYTLELLHNMALDTKDKGGLAALINHGPPNCSAFHAVNANGQLVTIVFALRDLENEELFFNYGQNIFEINKIPCYELGPEPIERFIEDTDNLQRFERLFERKDETTFLFHVALISGNSIAAEVCERKLPSDDERRNMILKVEYQRAMMSYLYYYPQYLLQLVQKKKLKLESACMFFHLYKVLNNLTDEKYHSDLRKKLDTKRRPPHSALSKSQPSTVVGNLLQSHAPYCASCFNGDLQACGIDAQSYKAECESQMAQDHCKVCIDWLLTAVDYQLSPLKRAILINDSVHVEQIVSENPRSVTVADARFAYQMRRREFLIRLHGQATEAVMAAIQEPLLPLNLANFKSLIQN